MKTGNFGFLFQIATLALTLAGCNVARMGTHGSDKLSAFSSQSAGPVVSITSPSPNTYTQGPITISGTCTDGVDVNISGIATPVTVTCSSGGFSTNTSLSGTDGAKTITATQTDADGKTGTATQTYNLLTVPPVVTISSPGANTYTRGPVAVMGSCKSGLLVNIGGGIIAPTSAVCISGMFVTNITLAGADGLKNVTATQIDQAGNTGSANRDFNLLATPPSVTITSPGANSSTQGPITLTGTCKSGLVVSITGGLNANCTAGMFTANITLTGADGPKTVTASQIDQAGNTGSASRTFNLLTTAPTVAITTPAAGTYTTGPLTLTGTCTSGLTVNIGGGITTAMMAACNSGTFTANVTLSGPDGTKTVTASQTDIAGNTGSANRDFNLLATPPAVTITAPAVNAYTAGPITLSGTCKSGLNVSVTGAITAPANVACTAGMFTANITLSTPDGVKSVTATQIDQAGNTGSANRTFNLLSSAPLVTITSPAANTFTTGPLTITGTCRSGLNVNIGGGITSATTSTCNAGTFSANVTLSGPDGAKTVTASQTDQAGNTGSANQTYNLLATPPTVTITSPAANTYTSGPITLTGTCKTGLTVNVTGGIAAPANVNCTAGTFTANITLSGADGVKTVTAAQTDQAGNTGSANRTFNLLSSAPAIAITSPAPNTYTQGPITLAGTCRTGVTVNISGGITTPTNVNCTVGMFTANITLAGPDGAKTVSAAQTDQAGNTGSDSRIFNLLATPPAVTITSPAANTYTTGPITLTGTCRAGLNVNISGGITAAMAAACNAGTFTSNVTLSGPDGAKTVIASQIDQAGNTGSANRTFNLLSTAPAVTITSPAANTYTQGAITLAGTCRAGLTVNISGGISAPTTAACNSGTFSANITLAGPDGAKTVTAAQTDQAGNTGSANRNFNLLTTPPSITITSPATGTSLTSTSITLAGTCKAGLAISISGTATGGGGLTCSAGGTYTTNLTSTISSGTVSITAAQTDQAGNVGTVTTTYPINTSQSTSDVFTANQLSGAVDILFIDDNSRSMQINEANLGAKFTSLAAAISKLNWQIGITTTDCSTGPWGICGSLLTLSGLGSTYIGGMNILTSAIANFAQVFDDTIVRPETVACATSGVCPAGDSTPLRATLNAMAKASTDNAGFFRSGADLAVVILTNADEDNAVPIASSTTPQQVINQFNSLWGGTGKKLKVYTIGVLAGDTACLIAQESTGIAAVATYPIALSNLTGGLAESICAPDYAVPLQSIGNNLSAAVANKFTLAHAPVSGTVQVMFSPAVSGVTWALSGQLITFSGSIPAGTQITVNYQY